MSFQVDYRMLKLFFDEPRVLRKIGEAKAKSLSIAGLNIRQAGRKLIGGQAKNAKPRPPGKPPKSHVPNDHPQSLRTILFHYAASTDSLVAGPVKLNQVQQSAFDLGSQTVPEIQEFGGEINIQEQSSDGGRTWDRHDMRVGMRAWRKYRVRKARYAARPFMGPALRKVIDGYRQRGHVPGLIVGGGSSNVPALFS